MGAFVFVNISVAESEGSIIRCVYKSFLHILIGSYGMEGMFHGLVNKSVLNEKDIVEWTEFDENIIRFYYQKVRR